MFRRKTTITRPDRDRLKHATQSDTNLLRWGLFIGELLREIEGARVIDPARVPPDVVTMHSTVRICDTESGTPEVYTLVYPEDAAPRRGNLSVFTSLGRTLLGRRARDVVRVETADGVRSFKVDAILYQPEAAESARLARSRATLRRARRGELAIVYVLAVLVLLAMLPAVIAAAAAWGAAVLWRHLQKRWKWTRRRHGLLSVRVLHGARRGMRVLLAAVRSAFQPRARLSELHPSRATPGDPPFGSGEHNRESAREMLGLPGHFRKRGRHHVGSNPRARRSERNWRTPDQCSATAATTGGVTR